MALVVEDCTGLANANGYIAIAFADTYFGDRGVAAWTGADALKEQAIIKATDYIETVYGGRFKGARKTETQALSYPRDDDQTVLPAALQKATAEYALRALTAPLMPDPVTDPTGGILIGKREKLGPIEDEWTYANTGGVTQPIKPYPAADLLLSGLIGSANRCIRN